MRNRATVAMLKTPTRILVLALLLQGGSASASAGEAFLSGKVVVEGAWPKVGISLRVDKGDGRMHTAPVAQDGTFTFRTRMKPGMEVTLTPYNETALDTPEPVFLTGYLKTKVVPDEKVLVKLQARRILTRDVRVLDQSGKPGTGIDVDMQPVIPLGPDPDAPQWKDFVSFRTDAKGILRLRYVALDGGSYALTVNAMDASGDKYVGDMALSGRQLADGAEPLGLTVKRMCVWLEARFRWDPDCGETPFKPNVAGNDWGHTVRLAGLPGKEALLDEQGLARFYDLKPGAYTIELSEQGRRLYVITRGSEKVTIPEGGDLPVRHTVTLMPAGRTTVAGTVVDRATGRSVAGASVAVEGEETVRTDADGAFALKGVSGQNVRLRVEHADYYAFEGVYPLEPGKDGVATLDVRLTPLPVMHVQILDRDTGRGVPGCRVYARNGLISRRIVTSGDGGCDFHLPDGRYRLLVKRPSEESGEGRDGEPKAVQVIVHVGELVVPKEGGDARIEVPAVAVVRVAVKAEWPEARNGEGPGVCLTKPADGTIMASALLNAQGECAILAGAGTYRLVVVADKSTAADGGEVKVKADAPGDRVVKVEVRQWRKATLTDDARIVLGEPIQE